MTDLHVQAPLAPATIQGLSRVVRWIWPEAGRIHERSEQLVNGQGGRSAQPKRWAVWMGIQCGLLSVSIVAAFVTTRDVALIVMALICSMAATYCGMRVDPAFVRLHDLKKAPLRRTVGATFYFSFSASALLLYLLPAFSGTPSCPLFFSPWSCRPLKPYSARSPLRRSAPGIQRMPGERCAIPIALFFASGAAFAARTSLSWRAKVSSFTLCSW